MSEVFLAPGGGAKILTGHGEPLILSSDRKTITIPDIPFTPKRVYLTTELSNVAASEVSAVYIDSIANRSYCVGTLYFTAQQCTYELGNDYVNIYLPASFCRPYASNIWWTVTE